MTADIYSSTLGLLFMGTGNDNNSWGTNANSAVFQIIEDAIANALTSTLTGGTLDLSGSPPPAAASQVHYAALIFTGTLTSAQIVKVPNLTKWWWVLNTTSAPVGAILTFGAITGGTLYTNGTYHNVPLTGGSGSGATATVVVSGNVVTSVTITLPGVNYLAGDSLSASASNIGNTGSGFAVAVASVGSAYTLTIETPSASATGVIPQNSGWQLVQCDGNNNIIVSPFNSVQIQMPDGSASAPSFSGVNEPQSGWYRHGTQDWRFAVAGIDVLQITGPSAGTPSVMNVLSPEALQVNGTPVAVGSAITNGATGAILTLGAITAGSLYTNGTYDGVPLTGGTGSGATANIVISGGVVTTVTLVLPGKKYTVGDTLSASAANIGGTGSGFSIPVATVGVIAGDLAVWKGASTIEDGGPAGALANLSTVTSEYMAASATDFGAMLNMQLSASVGSNILTVSVLGANGAAPSATNPVVVNFRNAASAARTSGAPVNIEITSALSIATVVGSGFGSGNGQPLRLWVVLFNNAGTPTLGLINCVSATQIFPLDETSLQTTTGMGSGQSAGIFYTEFTISTACAFRILGFLTYETALATAGTYNNAPDVMQLFGPGVKKPGDPVGNKVVPAPINTTTNVGTGQTQTSVTLSITPTSKVNPVEVGANVMAVTGSTTVRTQLSRGTTPTLFGNVGIQSGTSTVPLYGLDLPGTSSAQAYYVYTFAGSSGQGVINGGSVSGTSNIWAQELMG